ncbi:protein SCAI [Choanephora cucurbitarum]|nr:protein SCAI [Choanephora cucurbitarum]
MRKQKLVEEFQYLLEKSQSLFSGLRDLPPTGSHRQWRPYFEKTFEVYTKLWKFQQTHRSILEDKSNYGLKRWEVGEIASKIGQLYYHYYLRTSETNYLYESYVFYEAIHERQYFKDIIEVKNSALMIKKMRYYARFIIVCLLLNKDENVRQLIAELEQLIEEYTKSFKPPDAKEWQMVLEEIRTFTEAEKKLVPINLDRTPDKIQHRLAPDLAERSLGNLPKLRLQEAILVGSYQKQIKFSELTLDMYRMLQSLERKPYIIHPSVAANAQHQKKPSEDKEKKDTAIKEDGTRSNPHKYLLYRPSLTQLLVYISTAFKDTGDHAALLLYLSADGYAYPERTVPGYGGGANAATSVTNASLSHAVETAIIPPSVHCLHPADLIPFTRKPLFLIVDSDNSVEFKSMPNVFDQPVMCLMSPVEYPSSVQDKSEIGSLFTLFLHTPLLGFCSVSDIGNLDQSKWDECVRKIAAMEKSIGDLLISDVNVDKNIKRFMSDDFLYCFIVRFVLCGIFLRYHSSFKDEKAFPSSVPSVPESIYVSTEIVTMLGDLTAIADVGTYFSLPAYASSSTPTTAAALINTTNANVLSSSPTSTMATLVDATNTKE